MTSKGFGKLPNYNKNKNTIIKIKEQQEFLSKCQNNK